MPTSLFFFFSYTITPFFGILQSYPIKNANKNSKIKKKKKKNNTNDSVHMCMSVFLIVCPRNVCGILWHAKKTDYKLL